MTVKATWLSHSCFQFETGKGRILVDPFISGNPLAPVKADSLAPDAIWVEVSGNSIQHVGEVRAYAVNTTSAISQYFRLRIKP